MKTGIGPRNCTNCPSCSFRKCKSSLVVYYCSDIGWRGWWLKITPCKSWPKIRLKNNCLEDQIVTVEHGKPNPICISVTLLMPQALFIDITLKQEKYTSEGEVWDTGCLLISTVYILIKNAIINLHERWKARGLRVQSMPSLNLNWLKHVHYHENTFWSRNNHL